MPSQLIHYRFALGEYCGRQSYIIQTKARTIWHNVSPELAAILKTIPPRSIVDASLGMGGRFYLRWRDGPDVKSRLSRSLLEQFGIWDAQSLDELTLGADAHYWGIRGDRGTPRPIHDCPTTLVQSDIEGFVKRGFPSFLSFGYQGQWAYSSGGVPRHSSNCSSFFKETAQRVTSQNQMVTGVTFSKINWDWLMTLDDGTVVGHIDTDIAAIINQRMVPSESMTIHTPLRYLFPQRDDYKSIKDLFMTGWKHKHKGTPTVTNIYSIELPASLMNRYSLYHHALRKDPSVIKPNQRSLFHGTKRECSLGNGCETDLCDADSCNLCCILRKSFTLSRAGKTPGRSFMRFGRGVYTSSVSSKAHDYASSPSGEGYLAMFVAKVLLGNSLILYEDQETLKKPPKGYNSVHGDVGQKLNYDEYVVYREDAIIPAYLIIYKPDPSEGT